MSTDPGMEQEPEKSRDSNGPGARFHGAAGAQVGSGNVQVNNFYGNLTWAGSADAPLTSGPVPAGSPARGHAFISYVREDSDEVDTLQSTLEAAGIRVWRDTANLWPGENWRAKIRDAITHDALVFIACFSSHSAARRESYQNEELMLAIGQLRLRRPDDPWLIPVRLDNCDIPDLELGVGQTLASIHRADLFGPNRDLATRRLVAAVQRLLQQPAHPSATEPNASTRALGSVVNVPAQLVVGEIPRRPTSFQPRASLYAQLKEAPGVAVVTALTGGRGIGKTHLAAAFARDRIADGWPVVSWIVAEDAGQALGGMDRLGRALGLAERGDDSLTAAREARQWLETRADSRCLVVFDNVPDAAVVRPWLPAVGAARIIITSTNQSCGELGIPVPVDVFSSEEAGDYLRERTGLGDEAGARALAEELGCLPLALSQAAALARTQRLSYQRTLERIKAMPLDELLAPSAVDEYPRGATQSALLAVQTAASADPLARSLVSIIAVLSPAGTRRDLLGAYAALDENQAVIRAVDIDTALGKLAEASVLAFTLDGSAVLMHRFTQRVIRESDQRAGDLQRWLLLAARVVRKGIPRPERPWQNRALLKDLIAQVDMLWSLCLPIESGSPPSDAAREILALRAWSGQCLWRLGDSNSARERGPQVVADHEQLLGPDCEETMQALSGLALAYGDLGLHDEATQMNQRIVNWYTDNRGARDPVTLDFSNTLANNYMEAGRDFADPERLIKAIELQEQNLRHYEEVAGPGDAFTLRSGLNLSSAYRYAGRTADAVSLANEMLQRSMHYLGASHLRTRWAQEVLAEAYAADGRTVEATELIEQAAAGLDPSETDSWGTRRVRAQILVLAGLPDQAIPELRDQVSVHREILGDNSPLVRRTLESLAAAYRQAERISDAILTYEEALAICSRTIGLDNPIAVHIANELDELRRGKLCNQPHA